MQKAIMIHELPLITDPDAFFNVDKLLSIDVIDITDLSPLKKLKLEINKNAIKFNEKLYLPILLKGKPKSFLSKVTEGIPHQFLPGETSYIIWDGNLPSAIAKKKFYDISTYRNTKDIEFIFEHGWLYYTFVYPYENKDLQRKALNYHLTTTGILQAASLS